MRYRALGTTGWNVSEVGFGAWAIGGTWGPVDDKESLAALHRAVDLGVNFIDTADVYGDGRSEGLVGELCRARKERIYVATKAGRRLDPHVSAGYTAENLERFVDESRQNLGIDKLDLIQLHCPPTDVYYQPQVFEALDRLVQMGKVSYWGVSVERIEEGLKAMEYPNCQSVQIIYNCFRQRPQALFFPEALKKHVGVLARLPLSSGMLTGKLTHDSQFATDDHRSFNREGASFDRGETFSGVPYEVGLAAAEEIKRHVPAGIKMGQFALRWILMADEVTCAIPGAKSPRQAEENCAASELGAVPDSSMEAAREIYDRLIRSHVHQRW